jgi:hypothetical protein
MDKLVYTGPTCYLGQWHFTKGKIYDTHIYSKIEVRNLFFIYIMADNELRYYINTEENLHKDFVTLDKWRELQINKILTYE